MDLDVKQYTLRAIDPQGIEVGQLQIKGFEEFIVVTCPRDYGPDDILESQKMVNDTTGLPVIVITEGIKLEFMRIEKVSEVESDDN
jgi:hypothetical protein